MKLDVPKIKAKRQDQCVLISTRLKKKKRKRKTAACNTRDKIGC